MTYQDRSLRGSADATGPDGSSSYAKGGTEAVEAEEVKDAPDRLTLRQMYEEEPQHTAPDEREDIRLGVGD